MRKKLLVALSIILFGLGVSAENRVLKILSREQFIFENKNCLANSSCDLEKVEYLIENYEIGLENNEYNYGTRLFVKYRTSNVEELENYVFVQFIKGCQFVSSLESNKIIIGAIARKYRDTYINFNHRDWEIDSDDLDPAYNSEPPESRQYLYRWNTETNSYNDETQKLYGEERPKIPELYVSDRPGSAFIYGGEAKNISLRFRMCIYKAKDVPKIFENQEIKARPIHCLDWRSSWIYDHQNEKYENPYEISSVCSQDTNDELPR